VRPPDIYPNPPLLISSYTPTNAPKDSIITITGTGFSPTTTDNTVTINNIPATVLTATSTMLTIKVPLHAGTAEFNNSYGIGVHAAGNLYVADALNARIRKINPAGITVDAGNFRIRKLE